ncbi:MAG: mechanosensitive ion channel [Candidatus Riflebacteria bacterium]|nr:mechanosensitive ion channel [Candidatus Riflebacteria bacterium]
MNNRFRALLLFIIIINFIVTNPLFAEESPSEEALVASPTYEINNVSDLYKKSDEISEDSRTLEKKLQSLINISDIEKSIIPLRESLNDYKQNFKECKGAENTDIESMITLRGKVKIVSDFCIELKSRADERLKNIATLNKDWLDKRDYWEKLREQSNFVNNKTAKDIFIENDKIIDESLKLFDGVDTPVTSFNQKISDLNKDAEKLADELDKYIEELRSRLFKKTGHAMLTTKYFNEFDEKMSDNFYEGIAKLEIIDDKYFKNNTWVFIVQLILACLLAYFFKVANKEFMAKLGLSFVYKNPVAVSLIISVLVGLPFLESVPPIIKFIYNLIIGISFCFIICAKIPNIAEKASVILVFVLYMIYMVFDLINMPMALSRLIIAIFSLASGIYFLKINDFLSKSSDTNQDKSQELSTKEKVICKLIGIFMIVAFGGQLAGYTALANHVFDITLRSVLISLFAWLILGALKGLVATTFRSAFVDKHIKSIVSDVNIIINRFNFVITLAVIFIVFAGILAAWGVYDNTWYAVKSILDLGFTVQGTKITLGKICWSVLLFYIILSISWVVRTYLEVNFYPKRNIEQGVGISINRLIYYSFIVLAFALAMEVMGISLQSLTVIIGALGVGIGFGLQNIVNNFASGLILLFERSIKVGDVVVVNGTWGTVKHLGLRATIIQTFANAEMIVPNSDLVSSTVNNWTMTNRKTRFTIKVGVAYGTDTELVKKVLLQIAADHPNVLRDPAPGVVFTEFGDSSLNFELRCWVRDIANMWKTQDEIMYEVDKKFKENNISIPFPQRDLYIKEFPSNSKENINKK